MLTCLRALAVGAPLALAASLAGGAAMAQADYTADDIIEHFAAAAPVGTAKGLTIDAPVEPAPFDLRVTFALDSAELLPTAQTNLDQFAAALEDTRLSKYGVYVDGHTDQIGSDAYNRELSERRANAVVAYLVRKGVAVERLTPRGFGEAQPLDADGANPENRRVETSLSERVE
jgi:OOP family OmpA-OmpF porin